MQPFRPVVAAVRSATLGGREDKVGRGFLSPRTKTQSPSKHLGQAALPSRALRGPPDPEKPWFYNNPPAWSPAEGCSHHGCSARGPAPTLTQPFGPPALPR